MSLSAKNDSGIITEKISKYGWTMEPISGGYILSNCKKKQVCLITIKKDKYKMEDMGGNKLMTGRGQLGKSIDTLLTGFYFATVLPDPLPPGRAGVF